MCMAPSDCPKAPQSAPRPDGAQAAEAGRCPTLPRAVCRAERTLWTFALPGARPADPSAGRLCRRAACPLQALAYAWADTHRAGIRSRTFRLRGRARAPRPSPGGTPSCPIQTAPGVAGGPGTDAQTAARSAGTAPPARPLASKTPPALRRAQAGRPAQDPGSPHPGGTEAVGHASRKPGAGGRAQPSALRAAPAPGPAPVRAAPMLRRRARCVL